MTLQKEGASHNLKEKQEKKRKWKPSPHKLSREAKAELFKLSTQNMHPLPYINSSHLPHPGTCTSPVHAHPGEMERGFRPTKGTYDSIIPGRDEHISDPLDSMLRLCVRLERERIFRERMRGAELRCNGNADFQERDACYDGAISGTCNLVRFFGCSRS